MTRTVDKAIIANRSAMVGKYEAAGVDAIEAALQRLIAADGKRHLTTEILYIDDTAHMAAFGASPVLGPADERGAKAAVDAIADTLNPDYILLLDGPDVLPQIQLNAIPGLSDGDAKTETDLPYACATGAFSRQARAYLAATRVVGRLPMPPGRPDAGVLVRMIDRCASHQPRPKAGDLPFFAISADVWRVSTQLSLNAVFGSHAALHVSPDDCHDRIDDALRHPVHFINCHGAKADHRFYGQRADDYPVAMESHRVAPHVTEGAVVAAECCYGAMLYDKELISDHPPICMSYLENGAIAFVGSTNIAYGPADRNAQADLICQFFLEEVLKGASTGRALLRARQRFAQDQKISTPTNLKTLAQFVLYGDPSLRVVEAAPGGLVAEAAGDDDDILASDQESSRKLRRVALKSDGIAIAQSATYALREAGIDGNRKAVERFETVARQRGYNGKPTVFSVSGGSSFRTASKLMDRAPQIAVIVEETTGNGTEGKIPRYHVLTAHILGDGITAIEECESR
ncbi:C25 family cysteine peptidase [Xanthobacter flavus]|uniref:C25 family cysteine peptidase n=1 Tax=Xanthobacter flavus TaxID=281 RepID=UPI003726296D